MKKFFSGLSRNTFLLTFTSLFADISTEMLYPVLPVFITQTLKSPAAIVGIVEGIATATQNIVQGFSGTFADKFGKRKPVALLGYALAALTKPVFGISFFWQQVLAVRFLDRLGTGIRSAPRDGLIAQSATDKNRGKAFGLEGIGDNLGAFLGPLLAILLLFIIHVPIRWIFYLAFIPGFLAVLMILLVKEQKKSISENIEQGVRKYPFSFSMPKQYWNYLFVTAVFGLGNSSTAFLILWTKQIGVSLEITILIYAFFNLIAAISSYPMGFLSDKFGRKNILFFAFAVFLICYLGFAMSTNFLLIGFLFILYGIFNGTFRAVGKAFATDFVSPANRASAVGWYSTTIGLTGLIASFVGGFLWTNIFPQATFIYGAIFAFAGSVLLLFLIPSKKNVLF